ncbi:MAG TPA: methyl-accepting chemotaxis protein, partial [Bacillota bacterium]|nr:methyl-accepting chemotaxis protein [Bacillota bacterium]
MKTQRITLKSLRTKLVVMFLTILLLTIIPISIIVNMKVRDQLTENYLSSSQEKIIQVDHSINLFFDAIDKNVSYLSENPTTKKADNTLSQYMDKTAASDLNMAASKNGGIEKEIYDVFLQFAKSHPELAYVYLGTKSGGYVQWPEGKVSEKYDPRSRPWYQKAMGNSGQVVRTEAYYWAADNLSLISTAKTIKNEKGEVIGAIGMDVALNGLTNLFKTIKMGKAGYVMLLDEKGTVLADPKDEKNNFKNIKEIQGLDKAANMTTDYFETKINGEDSIANVYTSPKTGWKFIAIIPKEELLEGANSIKIILGIVASIFIVVGILVTAIFSNKLSKPIVSISEHLKNVASGNFKADIPEKLFKNKDEIGSLAEAVNTMQRDIRVLIKNVKDTSLEMANSSLTLSEISHKSSLTIGEVALAIEQIATSTTDQAKDAEVIANMSHQFGMKIKDSNDLITDVHHISRETNDLSESGKQIIRELYDTIS